MSIDVVQHNWLDFTLYEVRKKELFKFKCSYVGVFVNYEKLIGSCLEYLRYVAILCQLHIQLWPLGQIENHLSCLVIVNHATCHFKFGNQS